MLLLKLLSVRFSQIKSSVAKIRFVGRVEFLHKGSRNHSLKDGRVVKALDLKSNGVSPRRFESCSQRPYFFFLTFLNNKKHRTRLCWQYPFQFQSPTAFYSSKVILYHVTVSVNDVHCSFPLIYDTVTWVKPLHAHFPATLTWPAPYY